MNLELGIWNLESKDKAVPRSLVSVAELVSVTGCSYSSFLGTVFATINVPN
jgi:hypothetical protein